MAVSYAEVTNILKVNVNVGFSVGIFSTDASANYMRFIQDNEYSISFNYFKRSSAKVRLGMGDGILNQLGKEVYANATNSYFRISCGEYYVTDYDIGALLVMSVTIKFDNSQDKTTFMGKISGKISDIFHASAEIQKIVSENHINAQMVISAIQYGGVPTQLSKILTVDSNGGFYASNCALGDFKDCGGAVTGMAEYAAQNFPSQFSLKNNTGLEFLGISSATYSKAKYLGLKMPAEILNSTIIQDRKDLALELKKNQYYKIKLIPIVETYKGSWGPNNDLGNKFKKLLDDAENNIQVILRPDNPEEGAMGCFLLLDECHDIKQNIFSSLKNITKPDLRIVEEIKYILPSSVCDFYPVGNKSYSPSPVYPPTGDTFKGLIALTLTDKSYYSEVDDYNPIHDQSFVLYDNGTAINNMTFSGTRCYTQSSNHESQEYCSDDSWTFIISPYYFELFNSSDQMMD